MGHKKPHARQGVAFELDNCMESKARTLKVYSQKEVKDCYTSLNISLKKVNVTLGQIVYVSIRTLEYRNGDENQV